MSPPRMASIPRPLEHLNSLTIGGTTFLVHIHKDRVPCEDCSPKGGDEIALYGPRKLTSDSDSNYSGSSSLPALRDSKTALTMLKRSLLSQHDSSSTARETVQYVDRSARRRALYPDTSPVPSIRPHNTVTASPLASTTLRAAALPVPSPVSAPPVPLSESNIGHRLLLKQGWQPGMGLGHPDNSDSALVEPLAVSGNTGRTGLGSSNRHASDSSTFTNVSLGWKEEGKLKRWAGQSLDADASQSTG